MFAENMVRLGYDRIRCVESDIANVRAEDLGPVSVALLDVDLYRPTLAGLKLLWECLEPGGSMLVDDAVARSKWDGALQAIEEFLAPLGLDWDRVGTKGAAIQKPSGPSER